MKIYFLLFAAIVLCCSSVCAQQAAQTDTLLQEELPPAFPGGNDKLLSFIFNHLSCKLPSSFAGEKIVVRFIVSREGHILNPYILRGTDSSVNKCLLKVIRRLPDFIPARDLNNHAVQSTYTLPVYIDPDRW